MAVTIHPTAIVDKGAELADGVEIGPFCVVSARAQLHENVRLISHVSIAGSTTVGARTVDLTRSPRSAAPPQDTKYKGEDTKLIVGTDYLIRESAVLHLGTVQGRGQTVVGNKCMLMNASHVGHDGLVGNGVIYSTHAVSGGGATIEDFGHHRRQLPPSTSSAGSASAPSSAGARLCVGDVIPYGMVDNHGYLHGLNIVGLKRRGATRETIHTLRGVYRDLFHGEGYLRGPASSTPSKPARTSRK